MEYCPHCLRVTRGNYCEHCGGQMKWEAAAGQLPVGTVLQKSGYQSYQLGAAKGQGGFGITYAAMNLQNRQRVAVKEYFPQGCAVRGALNSVVPATGRIDEYAKGLRCFLDEAMTLSSVGSLSSVVTVIEYFEANGTAYLVMEYVDGLPLCKVVAQKRRIASGELFPMLPELLKDISVLHKSGIIHRDISPDNLILTPEKKLKLIDFGSARNMNSSQNMTVMLKPGFSPIEQYQSTGQGPYTDMYALAGTIYYCLTGITPPVSFDRVSKDTLQKPNALGAGLTDAQEKAIMHALAIRPEERLGSAEEFAAKLFPSAPRPITPLPPRRTKKGALIALAVCLAFSVTANIALAVILASGMTEDDGYSSLENDYKNARKELKALMSEYAVLEDECESLRKELGYSPADTDKKPGTTDKITEQDPVEDPGTSVPDDKEELNKLSTSVDITNDLRNILREYCGESVALDSDLVRAAVKRAQEHANGYTNERPDGTTWDSVFEEFDISWEGAKYVCNSFQWSDSSVEEITDEVADWIAEYYIITVDGNKYIANSLGVGVYATEKSVTVMLLLVSD